MQSAGSVSRRPRRVRIRRHSNGFDLFAIYQAIHGAPYDEAVAAVARLAHAAGLLPEPVERKVEA
jgi:hypothetical protein